MNNNVNEEKLVYQMLEINYIKSRGREVTWKENANSDLYPSDWFINTDYQKKIEILSEAISLGVLIIETPKYQEIIEGVRGICK